MLWGMDDEARLKRNEYMRRWSAANPDKVKQSYERNKEKHREKARLRAAAWYAANRDRALEASRARQAAKPKVGRRTGEDHHHWKGDDVGYDALHRWVVRTNGQPSRCEICGATEGRRFEWANVDHKYRRVAEDWLRLCTSCHRLYDYEHGLAAKGGRRKAT